jgi:hypothetical protein
MELKKLDDAVRSVGGSRNKLLREIRAGGKPINHLGQLTSLEVRRLIRACDEINRRGKK